MLVKDIMNHMEKFEAISIVHKDAFDPLYVGYCGDVDNEDWFSARENFGYQKVKYLSSDDRGIVIEIF